MKKLTALLLSVLLGFSSAAPAAQSGPSGLFPGFFANIIRRIEAGQKQIPDPAPGRRKVIADDTGEDFAANPDIFIETETWLANEITLQSEKEYADPFTDADVDLVLAGNGVKYVIPCFWNGGNTWKARFACPSAGEWKFETVCSDSENHGLHGVAGKVSCTGYSGELEIYRHGFVTTAEGKKYFTYADSTPFFYLGDTHWSLGDETPEMVNTICDVRARQGFTVIQSEPIGARFDLTNGVTEQDMEGFADYDEKFAAIAAHGLVHANAEFFFPAYMQSLVVNFGGFTGEELSGTLNGKKITARDLSDSAKAYLKRLCRYWVARYGAYPVMWTLGQEVDNDFYYENGDHPLWNHLNNPYKLAAEYISEADAYCHPLSAHQENSGSTAAYGSGEGTGEKLKKYYDAKPSVFRSVPSHDWYAVQWSPSLTGKSDQSREKEYWFNSQGKPSINYEGRYCYLWTKNFGSRAQGWISYLSGMFGYGWGAHDTWSYLNIYDEQNDSFDGVDTVTSEEKINATWQDALSYPSAEQMGHMKKFFTSFDWWNLIPRFDSRLRFSPQSSVLWCTAGSLDSSELVIYFYSFTDPSIGEKPNAKKGDGSETGRIGSLEPLTVYKYRWFDPLTGEFSEEEQFTSSLFGTHRIGARQWNGETVHRDMVFYMYK